MKEFTLIFLGFCIGFLVLKIKEVWTQENNSYDPQEIKFIGKNGLPEKKPRIIAIDENKIAKKEEEEARQ